MPPPVTLTDWEARCRPDFSPPLPRGAAAALAAPAYAARQDLAAGFSFAQAQARAVWHPRYGAALARWGRTAEWENLTGP